MPVQHDIEALPPAHGATAAAVVQSLLMRHGVDKRRFSVTVAEALGLSRSAAHNRVHKEAEWSWDDVIKLGKHFGESLVDLALGVAGEYVQATLHLEQLRINVEAKLGDGSPASSDSFAAFKTASGWAIAPVEKIGLGIPQKRVLEFFHNQQKRQQLRIALLDDDSDTLEALALTLQKAGCEVTTYTSGDKLVKALDTATHDAFVVDWLLANKTSEYVLKAIREKHADVKILILSGQLGENGKADDAAVAEAMIGYKAQFLPKPITPAIMISSLEIV